MIISKLIMGLGAVALGAVLLSSGCNSGGDSGSAAAKQTQAEQSAPSATSQQPDSPPASSVSTPPSAAQPPAAPKSGAKPATPKPDQQTPAPQKPPAAPAQTSNGLPADLQTEGFLYSGAGNSKPMDMQMTQSTDKGQVRTGAQTITFTGLKDGKATYHIDRTGGLADLGTEDWTVSKDGVFDTSSSEMTYVGTAMELPAVPKPGLTWTIHAKADSATAKLDQVIQVRIVGKQTVTVKAGTFQDALLVEGEGTGTEQGQKIRTQLRNWYVKGLGVVKASLKLTQSNGRVSTLDMEDTSR